ncbi:hypothetical protein [Nostoc sp. C057]|uniref:hypothetical protein n=1 Tax=Nostoc sp. C057 TaxID=2576903 RepID=UPI0015C3414C|nr:hypothetical protein [Nostoc sp. C057]
MVQYNPVANELSLEAQVSFEPVVHPYAVFYKDCDLDWDYRARQSSNIQSSKLLNSVILYEIATARS